MTDYSNYNEFLKGPIFRPSKIKIVQKREVNETTSESKKWVKASSMQKNSKKPLSKDNCLDTKHFKPTINVGDTIELLYIEDNETIKVTVFDNFLMQEVRFNDSPKSNRGTKAFVNVPIKQPNNDNISVLTELYNLIKYKKVNDIVEYNGKRIKIISIKKKVSLD